jgi:zinc protease
VIGREGCPLVDVSGARTVRYEECVALLRWPDGARQLIGADGLTVPIDPSLVEIDDSALTAIDVAVSPSVVISMPARAIPRPVAAPARPAPSRPRKSGVRKVVLLALAAVLGLFTAFATLGLAGESTADPGPWIVDGVAWCAAVAFAVLARRR